MRLEQYYGDSGLDTAGTGRRNHEGHPGDQGMKLEGNKEIDVVSFHISSMDPILNPAIGSPSRVGMVGFQICTGGA